MLYKVLVVDDDEDILELIKETLHRENISVITAKTGEAGIKRAETSQPDLIILDLTLPDIPGIKVYRVLKNEKRTTHIPVMILTGTRKSAKDMVFGFEEGVCEYMVKPFDPKVFAARVKNIFQLLENKEKIREIVKKCGVQMDAEERKIKVKDKIVNLTQKEFDLISVLVRESGRVLSREYLLETVWGYEDNVETHTLESHLFSIKKKVGPDCAKKIITIKGKGYKLNP
ncbi:MAG: response regulator transcription factor [Elusimicrobia bacterium]|nr:response regulator transcription factor [Elusimicrobiota bacterium]